eukprot:CAMPEP_0173440402 /NCGR_PEP_ID=MMETSP1357-20121228/22815_1 /TAXON_ID=77926 /ORGANISM="Hemiselmis rufescens, Strain PCC563" /LENGTH=88 /DNA_ID=CAMNT_0014405879 /DNA_START=19 /DNA_END=285 /DNA_ORIENTATION=+
MGLAAFTIGYQNGFKDSKAANGTGGQGYGAAYKAGVESGLKHEEHKLQFLSSMRRAREAYYASSGARTAVGGSAAMSMPPNPIDTGAL